jgi:hypothetical protein
MPWQPSVLLKDRALFWYTLSGLLASYVGGSFASCISQYVLAAHADSDFAEKVVAVVLPVNAAVVVTLQYALGRKISASNIRPLMTLATLFFIVGLGGFMLSGENLVYWGIAAAIFTLGEIIYAPGEYMLIDNIAPPGMKASYFSAQALGWLGAAANPMITGIILTNLPHWSLFVIMMVAIVMAWLMILRGMSVKAWCESPKRRSKCRPGKAKPPPGNKASVVQHLLHHLLFVHLVRIIGRPVIHLFQQRLVGGVAHENMEVRRGLRPDGMVAELNKLRRLAAGILTLKQIANAFLPDA